MQLIRSIHFHISTLTFLLLFFSALVRPATAQAPPELKEPTPGASVRASPLEQEKLYDPFKVPYRGVVLYFLGVKGFPEKEKLYLWVWPRGSPTKDTQAIPVITSGAAGEIFKYKGDGSPFGVALPSSMPGLNMVIMLATEDGKIRAWTTVTPRPLEARKGPCTVRAEIAEDFGAIYDVVVQGFPPGDDLKITVTWADQSQESSGKVKDDGTWAGQIKLNATDKELFKARLTLAGTSCSVSLPLERKNPKKK